MHLDEAAAHKFMAFRCVAVAACGLGQVETMGNGRSLFRNPSRIKMAARGLHVGHSTNCAAAATRARQHALTCTLG